MESFIFCLIQRVTFLSNTESNFYVLVCEVSITSFKGWLRRKMMNKFSEIYNFIFYIYSVTSQFTTSKFTILADSRFHIYFLKTSNSGILKNPSQFTDFLYYMHNKDPGNWEENSELGVVRLHNFNSRFPIHGKFLVPKNMNWEVAL